MEVPLRGGRWTSHTVSVFSIAIPKTTSGRKRTTKHHESQPCNQKNGTSARSLLAAWNPWLLKERSFTITPDSRPHSKHGFIPTSTNQTAHTTPLALHEQGTSSHREGWFPALLRRFSSNPWCENSWNYCLEETFRIPHSMGTHFSFIFGAYNPYLKALKLKHSFFMVLGVQGFQIPAEVCLFGWGFEVQSYLLTCFEVSGYSNIT